MKSNLSITLCLNAIFKYQRNNDVQQNIQICLKILLPNVVIEIINAYDYYFEWKSYTFANSINYLDEMYSMSVLSDGKIMGITKDSQYKIWDPHTGICDFVSNSISDKTVCDIVLSDGRIASADYFNNISIWNPQTKLCNVIWNGHTNRICCLALLPGKYIKNVCLPDDGKVIDEYLVSGSFDNTIKIWDVQTGECAITLKGDSKIYCVKVLSDGRIASGSYDKTITIWNLHTGKCDITLKGHTRTLYCIEELPDGRIVSGSADGTIKIWNLSDSSNYLGTSYKCDITFIKYYRSYKFHELFESINCISILYDERVIEASSDNIINIWDPFIENYYVNIYNKLHRYNEDAKCSVFINEMKAIDSLAILPDGRIVSGSSDNTINIWNPQTGQQSNP
jgi:WD40 repeat protein